MLNQIKLHVLYFPATLNTYIHLVRKNTSVAFLVLRIKCARMIERRKAGIWSARQTAPKHLHEALSIYIYGTHDTILPSILRLVKAGCGLVDDDQSLNFVKRAVTDILGTTNAWRIGKSSSYRKAQYCTGRPNNNTTLAVQITKVECHTCRGINRGPMIFELRVWRFK